MGNDKTMMYGMTGLVAIVAIVAIVIMFNQAEPAAVTVSDDSGNIAGEAYYGDYGEGVCCPTLMNENATDCARYEGFAVCRNMGCEWVKNSDSCLDGGRLAVN